MRSTWRIKRRYGLTYYSPELMAYEGGIGVYKKPQNRRKNDLKPQNRTKTHPKPKTVYKTVKTNKIFISGAFNAKYTDTYFINTKTTDHDLMCGSYRYPIAVTVHH